MDVSIHSSISDAKVEWQQLKDVFHSNPYQSPDWLNAWSQTLGKLQGVQVVIAVGRVHGRPVVLLPLGLNDAAGIKTLTFLGHEHGNQNTGCWDPAFYSQASEDQVRSLLVQICRETGADLLSLQNVPITWQGRGHPLLLANSTSSPSPIFVQAIGGEFDTLFRDTHSKSSRKNLLRKQKHLQSAEGYRVVKARTKEDVSRGFEAFLDQRSKRATAAGIPNAFSDPAAQEFLSRLLGLTANDEFTDTPPLDLWFLEAGGVIRSTYLCLEQAGTIFAYSNSVAHDDMLPNSPGLVLIKEIISYACAEPDLTTLDLGLGEERYKAAWAEPEQLNDTLLAVTWKGKVKQRLDIARTDLKSAIRNSETLWPLVRRMRKLKAGLSKPAGQSE